NTRAEALRSGLREVLERDAFATTWLLERPPPHIDLDRVPDPDVARWRDHHRRSGRSPSLLWLTNDIDFPVVAAQVVDPAGPRRHILGFGASTDPRRAMRRAVEEAEQGRLLLQHLFRTGARIPADERAAMSLEGQLMYWQDPTRLPRLGFLTDPERVVDPDDLADLTGATPYDDVQTILRLLHRRGLEAFFVDVTPPEFRGRLPLRVAASLVPGAQPVRMGSKPPCLLNPRLGRSPERLNTLPPPFA
ncbi:MAG: YcaO-like family protein, partial [bacterium]